MSRHAVLLLCLVGFGAALSSNPILRKLDDLRYQHVQDSAGKYHLVDTWLSLSDMLDAARFQPSVSNVYHLFTRANPTVSQPLLINNPSVVQQSNFNNARRTIVLIHGWRDGGVLSPLVINLVPAFLAAEDVNVIAVDWSAGNNDIFTAAIDNSISSGRAVAAFIDWLNQATSFTPLQYHIVGHGIGAHQAAVVGRNVQGSVSYITGLDPSLVGWINHPDRFQPTDAIYTEVIHTNCGFNGYLAPLADVDFYPNGGESMPGCNSHACDHERAIHYFAESIVSGGFVGRHCINYLAAILQTCSISPIRLEMGGVSPKIGSTGVYLLETNPAPPFSRD